MEHLLELARTAAQGERAGIDLRNALSSIRKQESFRNAVLKMATDEERHIANFARDHSGSDFGILCEIVRRHRATKG